MENMTNSKYAYKPDCIYSATGELVCNPNPAYPFAQANDDIECRQFTYMQPFSRTIIKHTSQQAPLPSGGAPVTGMPLKSLPDMFNTK